MCPVTQPIAGYLHRLILMRSVFILLPWKLRRRVRGCLEWYTVLYMTLYYNYFTTIYIALETLLEPMFWFVERFARYLGPIFVTLVTVMTTSVVTIFYVCLLPHLLQYYSIGWTIFHLVFGHWLLTNVIFHYVMAVFTQPGTPPDQNVAEVVSICKKCISPKPPRTHHCTICGKCILKMDHHCPWLNNCVGHHNHRYFFLFCMYMWFGTIYVSWSGHEVFRQHFYGDRPMPFPPFLYPLNAIHDAIYIPMKKEVRSLIINEDAPERGNYKEYYYHVAVLYQFILCSGITLALGLLMLWHAKLISAGETSIEVHINSNQRKKFRNRNLVYKNPYHYGFKKNWQVFLGFSNFRSFCRYVLLPSTHWPEGDGLTWARASYKYSSTRCLELL